MEMGVEVKAIQEELGKTQSELESLQQRWEELMRHQSPGNSSILLDILKQTEIEMHHCLAEAKLDQNIDADSLIASLNGLANDLSRFEGERMEVFGKIKAEEGRLGEIERQLNELNTTVEEGLREVTEEDSPYQFESQDYYAILTEFQNRNQIVGAQYATHV